MKIIRRCTNWLTLNLQRKESRLLQQEQQEINLSDLKLRQLVRKYQGQAKAFQLDQIKMAISDGVNYEEAVKTGRMNDQMAVELFIVQYSKKE